MPFLSDVCQRSFWMRLDKFLNGVLGGDPTETITRRTMRAAGRGNDFARALCLTLDTIDPGHCEDSP